MERRFFLVPDEPDIEEFVGYCLAVCLQRYGLELHAACVMSNHYHLDVTDPRGCMPAFKCMFNALVARGINARRGRFDRFWSADAPCDTAPPQEEQGIEDLAYTLANPTSAELVKWGWRWPGLTTYGMKFGDTRRFRRPDWFFDPANTSLPDEVELRLTRPNILPELSDDELHGMVMHRTREREQEVQSRMRSEGRRFKGEHRIRRQSWDKSPSSYEPRFRSAPKVASSSRWARLAQLQRNRAWEEQYVEARDGHRQGFPVVFPAGTYWLKQIANIALAPP